MENVLNKFFEVAGAANDWALVIRYQWVLSEGLTDDQTLDGFMVQKAKGA